MSWAMGFGDGGEDPSPHPRHGVVLACSVAIRCSGSSSKFDTTAVSEARGKPMLDEEDWPWLDNVTAK
jgi:hypothetical protein